MGAFFETIPESSIEFIKKQHCFWVATAPLSGDGHVNLSPKGGKYFGLIGNNTFWYHDLTGSGAESLAAIHEPGNGRICVMFNAFDGPPKILRLWGKGRALENGTKEFESFVDEHKVETMPGTRSIIIVDIHQVGTSCGFSVPYYEFKDYRPILNDFFAKKKERFDAGKTDESMDRYWAYKNAWSMDGLPGMKRAQIAAKRENVAPIKKMVGPHAPKRYQRPGEYTLQHVLLVAIVSLLLGIFLATNIPPQMLQNVRRSLDSCSLRHAVVHGSK